MAAPIYRDEFENRFVELVGYINTALEAQTNQTHPRNQQQY